jgi:hypothetical protein
MLLIPFADRGVTAFRVIPHDSFPLRLPSDAGAPAVIGTG